MFRRRSKVEDVDEDVVDDVPDDDSAAGADEEDIDPGQPFVGDPAQPAGPPRTPDRAVRRRRPAAGTMRLPRVDLGGLQVPVPDGWRSGSRSRTM